ncbi:DUF1523 family protein [Jannaschia sp.]|nr:DUF1523 family protein [Jannaschia sp.]
MRIVKLVLLLIVVLFVGGFLHYNLPDRDIVRITGTEVIRIDTDGWNDMFYSGSSSAASGTSSRDVRFINSVDEDRDAKVYRNQDTGIWPPYFKFDSGSLQAEAESYDSDVEQEWVAVRHYGWRFEWLSIFPNATSISPVEGPEETLIPWFNIVFLLIVTGILWAITVRVMRFRRRVAEDIGEAWDDAGDNIAERKRGLRDWFKKK